VRLLALPWPVLSLLLALALLGALGTALFLLRWWDER
jgi:hypothetical protein